VLAEECAYKLGNLYLLSGVNTTLGNKPFTEKRGSYFQSDLLLTQELTDFTEWNRKAIERRQKEMAKLAFATWRFQ
jgi:hypothetical protein